jgi:hypothetical protein
MEDLKSLTHVYYKKSKLAKRKEQQIIEQEQNEKSS